MATLGGILHLTGRGPGARTLDALGKTSGPGATHAWREGPVGLLLRAPDGLPEPTAPVVADDAVVLLDGWVDDAEEVLRRADHAADVPPSDLDAFAILAGWRRWGTGVAERLNGEFAAAIWDRRNERLVLLRDRHGTRPLFWARQEHRFAFASHLPALLTLPWVSRELDRRRLAEYLSFQTVHAPRTLLKSVHQVEAAHWLRIDRDELSTRRWWTPRYAPPGTASPRPGDVVPALQEAVERAVARRMRPGWTRALFLSGGLGSAAIAAAAKTLGRELPSYTVTLSDDPMPESPFAGRIASLLGLAHEEVTVESRDLARAFDETVTALGHPIGDPTSVLLHLLSQAAAPNAHLVFSGDGSEELFGGRMLDGLGGLLRLARSHDRLPSPLKRLFDPVLSRSRRGGAITADPDTWGLDQALGGNDLFSAQERAELLTNPDHVRPDVRRDTLRPFYQDVVTDPINAVLHAFLRSRLEALALVRTGRPAADEGLDARYPLLDREVVAMAMALPGPAKLQRGPASLHTRWPLQATLAGVLPSPLINRPKRSLPLLHRWLPGPGRLFLEERIARIVEAEHGLFQRRALSRLRRDAATDMDAARRLWTLFLLQGWMDANAIS